MASRCSRQKHRIKHACLRCRLKKSRCDGQMPCYQCCRSDSVCSYSDRKPNLDRRLHSRSYVELLDQQLEVLRPAVKILYERLRVLEPDRWPSAFESTDSALQGIVSSLGLIDGAGHLASDLRRCGRSNEEIAFPDSPGRVAEFASDSSMESTASTATTPSDDWIMQLTSSLPPVLSTAEKSTWPTGRYLGANTQYEGPGQIHSWTDDPKLKREQTRRQRGPTINAAGGMSTDEPYSQRYALDVVRFMGGPETAEYSSWWEREQLEYFQPWTREPWSSRTVVPADVFRELEDMRAYFGEVVPPAAMQGTLTYQAEVLTNRTGQLSERSDEHHLELLSDRQ